MKNLFTIILVFYAGIIFAQKQNNNWINGNRLWNFSNTTNGNFTDSSINTGSALKQSVSDVSDKNTGDLLFYTNSINIYNKNHNIMENGADLFGTNPTNYSNFQYNVSMYGGNSSAQGSVIIPFPGNLNKFYSFSLVGNNYFNCSYCNYNGIDYKYGLRYAIVDMSFNSGLGKVISKNNILFNNTNTDVMTYCPSNDGGYWLVTQNDAGNFLSYKITASGISSPITSSQAYGIAHDGLKISPNKQYLFDIGGRNLYNFNSTSGQISLLRNMTPNGGNYAYSGGPGSAEFSEDSNIIYFTSLYATLGSKNSETTILSSQSYYLCKYNINTNQFFGMENGNFVRSVGASSLQRNSDGLIYLKSFSKKKSTDGYSYYFYDDGQNAVYKIINSNLNSTNFNNLIYITGNNGNGINYGYTFPQLVEYPPVCINTLTITQNITSSGSYNASNQITASSIINPNLNVNYAADNQINLLPGFQVSGNSTGIFRALIQPCIASIIAVNNPEGKISSKLAGENIEINNIKIYPNPTSNILTIDSRTEKLISWQLYDVSGKLMKNGNTNTVNVQSIPNASYVLKINLEKTQISKTIIVKH